MRLRPTLYHRKLFSIKIRMAIYPSIFNRQKQTYPLSMGINHKSAHQEKLSFKYPPMPKKCTLKGRRDMLMANNRNSPLGCLSLK